MATISYMSKMYVYMYICLCIYIYIYVNSLIYSFVCTCLCSISVHHCNYHPARRPVEAESSYDGF